MASREAKRCKFAKEVLKQRRFQKNSVVSNPSFLEFVGRQIGAGAREVSRLISENAIDISRFIIEFLTRVPILDAPQPIIPLPALPGSTGGQAPPQFRGQDVILSSAQAGSPRKLVRSGAIRTPSPPVSSQAPPVSQDPGMVSRIDNNGGRLQRIPDSPGGGGSGRSITLQGGLSGGLSRQPVSSVQVRRGRSVNRPQDAIGSQILPSSQIQFST